MPDPPAPSPKPTIDERLAAIAQSVELLTRDTHEMRAATRRLDARERRARAALLTGIASYMQALKNDGDDQQAAG